MTLTLPAMRAFEASKDIRPSAVVDLPDPDSPTIAVTLPAARPRFISITAGYQTPSTQKSTLKSEISSTFFSAIVTHQP